MSSAGSDYGTDHAIKRVNISDYTDSDEESTASVSTSVTLSERHVSSFGYRTSPEYFQVQKLIKFIKAGNESAVVVALCCILDFDLQSDAIQSSIQNIGGLETLTNLVETQRLNCQIGALKIILEIIRDNEKLKKILVDLGLVAVCVNELRRPSQILADLKILLCETLYYLCTLAKARKEVRHHNAIPLLIDQVRFSEPFLKTDVNLLDESALLELNTARSAIRALCSISNSQKNISLLMKYGCVSTITKLLASIHQALVIPVVGLLSQCLILPSFQLAVNTETMVESLIEHLKQTTSPDLKRNCCEALCYAANDTSGRQMIRKMGGLNSLVMILQDETQKKDTDLVVAVTAVIWKMAVSPENVQKFDELNTISVLVNFLENPDEEDERILSNVTGALYEFIKFPHNRETLRKSGGIASVVNLLNYTYPPLLENLPMVLRESAEEEESMRVIEECDGIRLIWSLLKNVNPKVQANAAYALVNCIKYSNDSAEMVRSFVGGMELVLQLLNSNDEKVLGYICAVIAEIAKDVDNLAVLTDHGLIQKLVDLIQTKHSLLREHLASAIGNSCHYRANCKTFGRLGAIIPLVSYMQDSDINVQRTAAEALYQLSENYFNCITMHESGVVKFLLVCIRNDDKLLQESAGKCLSNIRKLAIRAERAHLFRHREDFCTSGSEYEDPGY